MTWSGKPKHLSTQVRPGNLVHDEEWEADYYDLRSRSGKSKHFSTQVRPGNLVHDEEWEADYYDLRSISTRSSATSLSTSCRSS
jgi:hypothetical protein